MNEIKKIENYEEIRLMSPTPRAIRSKQPKIKPYLRTRQVFLTDTQTDQTKSSNQLKSVEMERLEASVKRLEKQNLQLRDAILHMKTNQFYGINEDKVRELIKQNEYYRYQMKILKKQLQNRRIQNDFLERNNRIMKEKLEEQTKQNNKQYLNTRMKTQQSRIRDYELLQNVEMFYKQKKINQKLKRSISNDKNRVIKKKTGVNKIEEKGVQKNTNPESKKQKQIINTPKFNQDYYILRQVKSNPKKISHF